MTSRRAVSHPAADPSIAPYLAAFAVLGVCLPLLGPAITHLRDRLDQGVGAIGVLFTLQALGGLVGSVVGGRAVDRLGGHRTLGVGLGLCALGALGMSALPSLAGVGVAVAVLGVGAGAIDVAANTLVMWSRSARSGPALNALHLCFGLGALAVPLAVDRSLASTGTLWPVAIAASVAAVAVVALLVQHREPVAPATHQAPTRPAPTTGLLAVLAVFFVLYVGAEVAFGGWVHTYAEEVELGDTTVAALLTAWFWLAFTSGRVLAVRVSRAVAPAPLLVASCVVALSGAGLLVLGGGAAAVVWIGTAAYGGGLGPQFATAVALTDRHLEMTGSATAWIIGGSSLGALVLPWGVGVLMDRHGADALPAASLVAMGLVSAGALVLGRLLRSVERDYRAGRQRRVAQGET